MTQKDNILQELNELQSSLVNAGFQNVYQVPDGYFDTLAEQVLNRIKALDTESVSEELGYLSPLLNSVSKKMPYSVPADFFNLRDEEIMQLVKGEDDGLTAAEELTELSPLLSGLKKEMPYHVPAGYFDSIGNSVNKEKAKPAKVVSMMSQKWFRYAAAAVVIGFVAVSGFFLFVKKDGVDPKTESAEWVKKNLKKVSTDEIDSFVQLTAPVIASVETKNETKDKIEVKELIKDISDKDIQQFLDETQANETESDDDALMN
jgi:hypothetical protein